MEKAPHPFSLYGVMERDLATTKNSGDFAKQIYESLELDARVSIDGPYGRMDFSKGKRIKSGSPAGLGSHHLWNAERRQIDQSIKMFYSYQNWGPEEFTRTFRGLPEKQTI